MSQKPAMIIQRAVSGMIPTNKFRDQRLGRLKIYAGSDHPYQDRINK